MLVVTIGRAGGSVEEMISDLHPACLPDVLQIQTITSGHSSELLQRKRINRKLCYYDDEICKTAYDF